MEPCPGCRGTGIITSPLLFPWRIFTCPMCDGRGERFKLVLHEIRPLNYIKFTLVPAKEDQ